MTLTLTCDLDVQTRPIFVSSPFNYRAERMQISAIVFKLSCRQTYRHTHRPLTKWIVSVCTCLYSYLLFIFINLKREQTYT